MFEKFLDESYTSDMKKVFSEYLKDIGDWFAKEQNSSVQKMDFTEFELDKPKALSNMYKKSDEIWDFITSARTEAEYVKKALLNRAYIICKHQSGGVTAFATNIAGKNYFTKPEKPLVLGDTNSKVVRVFVSFGKFKPQGYDINNVPYDLDDVNVAKERQKRADLKNSFTWDNHDKHRKEYIDRIINYNSNPICKEIRKKARSLGLNKFRLYAVKNEGKNTYYVDIDSRQLSLGDHIADLSLSFSREYDRKSWNSDINDPIEVVLNCSFWSGNLNSNNSDEINDYFNDRIEAFEKIKEIGEFVEYLNTLTVADIVIDSIDED